MDPVTKTAVDFEEKNWNAAKATFLSRHKASKPEKIQSFLADRLSVLDAKAACQTAQNTAKSQYSPALGGIMDKIESFMKLGDLAIKSAPESVGLAWTGIRLCLRAVEDDYATFSIFSGACSDMIGILISCGVYGKMYGSPEGPEDFQELHTEVVKRIPGIYADMLEFSYAMKKHMSDPKLLRFSKAIFSGSSSSFQGQINAIKDGEKKMSSLATKAHERLSLYYQKASSKNQDVMLDQLSTIKESLDASTKVNSLFMEQIRRLEEERKSMRKLTPLEQAKDEFNLHVKELGASSDQYSSFIAKKSVRDPKTCKWIFPLDRYKSWVDADHSSLLWVSGHGGFGKSFLMSAVIESLQDKFKDSENVVVHYFFVVAGDEVTQKSERILKHILYQLYSLCESSLRTLEAGNKIVADFLKKKGASANRGGGGQQSQKDTAAKGRGESERDTLEFDEAYAKLATTLQKQVFLVIDGVDECNDRQQHGFLKLLTKASEASGVNLKLMICSRPETDISLDLENLPQIKVEGYNAEDIREHANTQLQSLPGWTSSERQLACDEIVKKAGSFFRYVEVALTILRQPWQRPIENKLKELPEGLNNIYSQVLRKTNPEYLGLLRTCLMWTILAEDEPVKVAEVVDAYSHPYSQDDQEAFTDGDSDGIYSKLYQEQVTIAGGSFINVDPKTTTISLRHNTIADYFLDDKRVEEFEEESSHHACNMCERCHASLNGKDPFLITKKHGHLEMTTIIFQHLNSSAFRRKFYPPEVILERKAGTPEGPEECDKPDRQSEPHEEAEESKDTEETSQAEPPNVSTTNGVRHSPIEGEAVSPRDTESQDTKSAEPGTEVDHLKQNGTSTVPAIEVTDMAPSSSTLHPGTKAEVHTQPNDETKQNGAVEDPDTDRAQNQPADGHQSPENSPDDASIVDSDAEFKYRQEFSGRPLSSDNNDEEDNRYEIVFSNFHLRMAESLWTAEERAGPAWESLWKELDAFWIEGPAFRQWAIMKCGYDDTPYFENEGDNITPLHFIASNILPSLTARLLARGDDVKATTKGGRQPLHFAANWDVVDAWEQERKTTVMKLLLDSGASPNAADNYPPPFSMLLLTNPILQDVRLFLDNPTEKANCLFQDPWGRSPLHYVALCGTRVDVLEALLEAGADINAKDTWGNTPLHRLVWRQDLPNGLLQAFLASGADVNIDDNNSERPLYVACAHGSTETARILIDAGADLEDDDINGSTALHGAAFNAQIEATRLLIQKGVQLERCDNEGRLALHVACENDTPDVALLLVDAMLKNGQDINPPNKKGKTVLRKACARGHIELVKVLLDNIVDPVDAMNSTDASFGQTCLHAAANKGHDDIVKLLLSRGAHTNVRDKQGQTPLTLCYQTWAGMDSVGFEPALIRLIDREPEEAKKDQELLNTAAIQGSVAVIQKLLQLGVDPNRRDEHGWTAVQLAKRYGRTEAAESLGSGAIFRLKPTKWAGACPSGFAISEDGLTVMSEQSDQNILCSFFSNHPVPADVERYYFEVEIADTDKEDEISSVGIGFCQRPLKSGKGWFPGLSSPENPGIATWGYHGDDGLHQHPPNDSLPDQVMFHPGDTVGCGVDFKAGEIFITRNGERLPDAKFADVKGRLHPVIGVYSVTSAMVNFGVDKEKRFKWEPGNSTDFRV